MTKLDEIAINIELIVISIIEGVALTFLAENAARVLANSDWATYLPFVLAGFAVLLVFFAQAVLHVISFIRWPLRMEHMLFYFVAAFCQIVAYTNIESITKWFFWWTIFSAVALAIYFVDLRIIRSVRSNSKEGGAYMQDVEKRHLYELKYIVPAALAFNIIVLLLLYQFPFAFVNPGSQITLGVIQLIISIGALVDCLRNFHARTALIGKVYLSEYKS